MCMSMMRVAALPHVLARELNEHLGAGRKCHATLINASH